MTDSQAHHFGERMLKDWLAAIVKQDRAHGALLATTKNLSDVRYDLATALQMFGDTYGTVDPVQLAALRGHPGAETQISLFAALNDLQEVLAVRIPRIIGHNIEAGGHAVRYQARLKDII